MRLNLFMILFMFLALMNCSTTSPTPTPDLPDFDQLWDYSNPEQTEAKFLEIQANTDLRSVPGYALELKTQIARALGLQQKYEEAHRLLNEVEAELSAAYPIARIRYLLERGRVHNSSGEREESRAFFLEAWELSLASNADFYSVDAAHMLGIVEKQELQLDWNEKAMNLAELSEDPRARNWLGSLYNNIGWTYHGQNDFEKALEIFEKTKKWYKTKEDVPNTQIAEWSIARTQRSLGNNELALDLQLKLQKDLADKGMPEDGYVSEEIAECLLLLDKPTEAAPHFKRAWELLSEDTWLQQNESERLARLKEFGSTKP